MGKGVVELVLWIVLIYLFLRVLFPQIFAPVPLPLLFAVDSFAVAMLFATGALPLGFLLFTFYHLVYILLYALFLFVRCVERVILAPLCVRVGLGCDLVESDVLKNAINKELEKQLKKQRKR